MGRYKSIANIVFVIILLVVDRAFSSDTASPISDTSQTVTISGKVINLDTGVPVPNFGLNFECGGKSSANQIKTDSDGQFHIVASQNQWARIRIMQAIERDDLIRNGDYLIDREWLHQNHTEQRGDMIWTVDHSIPFDGGTTCNLTNLVLPVRLVPLRSLTGHVIDENRRPNTGATICCDQDLPTACTDGKGFFKLKSVPANRVFKVLALSRNGDKSICGISAISPGTLETTIVLRSYGEICGRMVTTEGLPAKSLSFEMMPIQNGGKIFQFSTSHTTDDSGNFTIPYFFPGIEYQASWFSNSNDHNPCYESQEIEFAADPISKRGFVISGVRCFPNILKGQIVDQAGVPIPDANAFVRVVKANDKLMPKYRNRGWLTREDGSFESGPFGAGKIELQFSAKGYQSRKITLATDEANARIVLQAIPDEIVSHLRVGDETGKPVPLIPVSIWFPSYSWDSRSSLTLTTDANGTASYKWRTSGYLGRGGLIYCDAPGFSKYARGFSTDDDDRDISITLCRQSVSLGGCVLDQNRKPISGAKVQVILLHPAGHGYPYDLVAYLENAVDLSCQTDDKGEFRFDRISARDNMSVNITAQGYGDEIGSFDSNGSAQEKTITLVPGGSVKGRVVFHDEASLPPNMECSARPITTGGPNSHYTLVGKDGSFEIQGLKPGLYAIWATDRRSYNAHRDSAIEERLFPQTCVEAGKTNDVTVEVQRAFRIKVKASWKDSRTSSSANATLHAKGPYEKAEGIKNGACQFYLASGTYRFEYTDSLGKASVKPDVLTVGKTEQNVAIEIER